MMTKPSTMLEDGISKALPFGISSYGRALPDVDGERFIVERSAGSRLFDQSGRSYVDYCMAMGANLIGHANPAVREACIEALTDGALPGFTHRRESAAADALASVGGRLSRVTFTSTGSEAVHLACRIARGFTGRRIVAKAVGGYDGWYDDIRFGLVGSPEAGLSNTRPKHGDMVLFRTNDPSDLQSLFDEFGPDLAAILIEPVLGSAGCLTLSPEFIANLAAAAKANGTLIISDEVMVGLRLGLRSVAETIGLPPDLMTMGKAIGSGLPVAAVLGTPKVFSVVESGQVGCYGTYQGNPVVTAAVSATIEQLRSADYAGLSAFGQALKSMIFDTFAAEGIPVSITGLDAIFAIWFSEKAPTTYDEAHVLVQPQANLTVYEEMRRSGVIVLPSGWSRYFVSFTHGAAEAEITAAALKRAASALRGSGKLAA